MVSPLGGLPRQVGSHSSAVDTSMLCLPTRCRMAWFSSNAIVNASNRRWAAADRTAGAEVGVCGSRLGGAGSVAAGIADIDGESPASVPHGGK
jgi:hypothetical protein